MTTRLDYVKLFPNILEPSECNTIIDYYEEFADWGPSHFAGSGYGTIKDSPGKHLQMDEWWITKNRAEGHYSTLWRAFAEAVETYRDYYPDININMTTPFRLNRYSTGGWMQRHIDNIAHSHGQEYGFPHITSLLFLNDNYEGGNFVLCDGEFEKKPTQGSCVVFPSNFMYPHEVKEVTKGTRYSVMTWIL